MTTIIRIPSNTHHIMFNGYATPYSTADMDWMSDSTWVMDNPDDDTLRVINDLLFYDRGLREASREGWNKHAKYCQWHRSRKAGKLRRMGYVVEIV